MADIYGIPVLRPALLEEATSLGAAVAGGVGVGLFRDFTIAEKLVTIVEVREPDRSTHERYEAVYPTFCAAYDALVPIFERLALG